MGVAMLGYIPVFIPILSVLVPLVGGIPFMLFLTKVKKFGMVFIMADLILKSGDYKSAKKGVLGYGIFSTWLIGNYVSIVVTRDNYYSMLISGYGQRVAIASALAAERLMLIFDEPTSGLDFWHMKQVADHIKALTEKDKTVFIVTHAPEFIMACCDYILYLEQGKVQACFPLDEKGTKRMKDFFEIDGR